MARRLPSRDHQTRHGAARIRDTPQLVNATDFHVPIQQQRILIDPLETVDRVALNRPRLFRTGRAIQINDARRLRPGWPTPQHRLDDLLVHQRVGEALRAVVCRSR